MLAALGGRGHSFSLAFRLAPACWSRMRGRRGPLVYAISSSTANKQTRFRIVGAVDFQRREFSVQSVWNRAWPGLADPTRPHSDPADLTRAQPTQAGLTRFGPAAPTSGEPNQTSAERTAHRLMHLIRNRFRLVLRRNIQIIKEPHGIYSFHLASLARRLCKGIQRRSSEFPPQSAFVDVGVLWSTLTRVRCCHHVVLFY